MPAPGALDKVVDMILATLKSHLVLFVVNVFMRMRIIRVIATSSN
jgi:hypothetical protein